MGGTHHEKVMMISGILTQQWKPENSAACTVLDVISQPHPSHEKRQEKLVSMLFDSAALWLTPVCGAPPLYAHK